MHLEVHFRLDEQYDWYKAEITQLTPKFSISGTSHMYKCMILVRSRPIHVVSMADSRTKMKMNIKP